MNLKKKSKNEDEKKNSNNLIHTKIKEILKDLLNRNKYKELGNLNNIISLTKRNLKGVSSYKQIFNKKKSDKQDKERDILNTIFDILVEKVLKTPFIGLDYFFKINYRPEKEPYLIFIFPLEDKEENINIYKELRRRLKEMEEIKTENLEENKQQKKTEEKMLNNEKKEEIEIPDARINPSTDSLDKTIDRFKDEAEKTIKKINLIKDFFSELDTQGLKLLKRVIKKYCRLKSKIFKNKEIIKYELLNNNHSKFLKLIEKDPSKRNEFAIKLFRKLIYYEIDYEDLLTITFKMVKFLTGLTIIMELDTSQSIFVKIFLKNDRLRKLASGLEYEMQLNPYALFENQFSTCSHLKDQINKLRGDNEAINLLKEDDINLISNSYNNNMKQFHESNFEDQFFHPPYFKYQYDKCAKFRRYLPNDDYHNCENDITFKFNKDDDINSTKHSNFGSCEFNCSEFRNIDKLRIIHRTLDEVLHFSILKSSGYLKSFYYMFNYDAYRDKLYPKKLLYEKKNIFDSSKQIELVHTIRNFYGEKVAFYYLWSINFNIWLIFPSVVGFLVFIFYQISLKSQSLHSSIHQSYFNISPLDLVYFIFSFAIASWAALFLKVWIQKETIYSYFWGTRYFEENEPVREEFVEDDNIELLFNEKIPQQKVFKKQIKFFISYLIISCYAALTIFIVYKLFEWKAQIIIRNATNNTKDMLSTNYPLAISMLNGVQIKIMSLIYTYIAKFLTDWENHDKNSVYENSLIIKIIIFEFINNYNSLYYIAFIKGYTESCTDNNCMHELQNQIYMILITCLAFNFIEVGQPYLIFLFSFLMNWYNKRSLLNKYKFLTENDFCLTSVYYQSIMEEYDTLLYDYNGVMIYYGYVVLFSVAAPLTPLIVFILIYFEKFVDVYKMFHLQRVTIIGQSNGIAIYKYILIVFFCIGVVTNVALVLFTNPDMLKATLLLKFIISFICENVLIIILFIITFNITPFWFKHISKIEWLYDRNYYRLEVESLPHNQLIAKNCNKMLIKLTKNANKNILNAGGSNEPIKNDLLDNENQAFGDHIDKDEAIKKTGKTGLLQNLFK